MNILITEGQLKQLSSILKEETNAEYAFYELLDQTLYDVLGHIKKWEKMPPFRVINPIQYKRALDEFIKYGQFIRFPAKIILGWKNLILHNIALLSSLTDVNGHSNNGFPHEEIYEFFDVPEEDRTEDFGKDWEILFGDKDPDEILPTFSNGQPVLSDYGVRPLLNLAYELVNQQAPEDIIVTINKILDVAHQRSDLPELFVKGGSQSQYQISNS